MNLNTSVTGIDQVRAMMQRLTPALTKKALAVTVENVEDYIRQEAGRHEKTGVLNSSIFKKHQPDGSWIVGHDEQRAKHAVFVIFGTRPHPIFPKGANLNTQRELYGKDGSQRKLTEAGKLKGMPGGRKLVLRWASGGKFFFAQHVNHPGNKPDNWIERASALAPQMFAYQVEAQIARINQGQP